MKTALRWNQAMSGILGAVLCGFVAVAPLHADEISFDEKAAKTFLTIDAAAPIRTLIENLSALNDFIEPAIEQAFTSTLEEHGVQMGKLAQPVRVALTGGAVSPGIHDVIAVLGKERTIRRLRSALEYIG